MEIRGIGIGKGVANVLTRLDDGEGVDGSLLLGSRIEVVEGDEFVKPVLEITEIRILDVMADLDKLSGRLQNLQPDLLQLMPRQLQISSSPITLPHRNLTCYR